MYVLLSNANVPKPLHPNDSLLTCASPNRYIYQLNFFTGFIVSSGVYFLLCKVSPVPATSDRWLEVDDDTTGRSNSLVYGADNSDPESGYDERADEYRGVTATKY